MSLKNKKQIASWCLFDFANSSFSAVIAAVIFPVYYANYIVGNDSGYGDLWWGRVISFSMAVVVLTSPFVGGIADYKCIKKKLLFVYTAICVIAVSLLSLIEKGMVVQGFLLASLATIGMEGGVVFYNSFLPEIADKKHYGKVSGYGFGTGYAGSILSLVIAFFLMNNEYYGLTWIMVSVFFALFSLPAFIFLPSDKRQMFGLFHSAKKGMKQTLGTFKNIWANRELRKFLAAYLIYEDGVNTVIVFSGIFAATTLGFSPHELIILYLVIQITALIGAFAMSTPTDLWGPKKVIAVSLFLWFFVSVLAFFVYSKSGFWIIAVIAGLGLGAIQSASRVFFARFIPSDHESEYFGVYSMVGKSSAIFGPLVFGYISSGFGSQRYAILSIASFFLAGLFCLRFVKK